MASDELPRCNPEIFREGSPVVLFTARSMAAEKWVRAVAEEAKARLDWYYSGGIAQMLHIGSAESRAEVEAAITKLENTLDGTILRRLPIGAKGLYRKGVSAAPEGASMGFYLGGEKSAFA